MVHVELDTILTEEDALQRIKEIFDRVETEKVTYVITHNGKPSLAIVDIATLEHEGSGEPFHTPVPAQETVEPTIATPEPAPRDVPVISPSGVPSTESASSVTAVPASTPIQSSVSEPSPSLAIETELPPMPDMPTFHDFSTKEPVEIPEPQEVELEAPTMPAAPAAPPAPSAQIFTSAPEPETDLDNSSPLA